jgi:thioredoxin-like negative regulator of GroEL
MKLLIIYHPNSEFSTAVENFASECKRKTSKKVELVSLESPDGASIASVYDLMAYPAIIILREDGQLVKDWQGGSLPTKDEVLGYLNS